MCHTSNHAIDGRGSGFQKEGRIENERRYQAWAVEARSLRPLWIDRAYSRPPFGLFKAAGGYMALSEASLHGYMGPGLTVVGTPITRARKEQAVTGDDGVSL
jgi:hypothetical protein